MKDKINSAFGLIVFLITIAIIAVFLIYYFSNSNPQQPKIKNGQLEAPILNQLRQIQNQEQQKSLENFNQ